LRSRPRRNAFEIWKKRDGRSSKPTPKDSERWQDAQGKTETVLTDSGTSLVSPNQPLHYGLHLKIRLPAQYLSTTQTEPGNYDGNATWFLSYSPEPRPTPKTLSYEELMQFKPLNASKWTPIQPASLPTDIASKTNASWSQSKQSGTSIGQTPNGSSKMEKLSDTKDVSQEIFQLDTLYHLA
jgi:hypothetical protein